MQVEINPEKYQLEEHKLCARREPETKLDQCIKNIIDREGFLKYDIEKKCISTNGGNYLGTLYEIDVKGKTREGDKELNIFVKNIIQSENENKLVSIAEVYQTEVFAYKELLSTFTQLQHEANVPSEERYKKVKCYDESNEELIIMENISKKGYATGYRMDTVSLKFAEMSIRELAKFHALSFVLKEKRPDYFENQIKTMKVPFVFGEDLKALFDSLIKIAMTHIGEDYKERLENFCVGILNRYENYFKDEASMRCLCHGDYRPNNIMAKIINGECSDIIPVDYQLLYYGCPVIDFFYFIFSGTDRAFRKAHLANLKDLYFETLTTFLIFFDIDVNAVYSRKEFDKDFKSNMDYGLVLSILMLPFLFVSENNVPDIVNDEMTSLSLNVDDKYKDRLRDVVEDYIEWGFI